MKTHLIPALLITAAAALLALPQPCPAKGKRSAAQQIAAAQVPSLSIRAVGQGIYELSWPKTAGVVVEAAFPVVNRGDFWPVAVYGDHFPAQWQPIFYPLNSTTLRVTKPGDIYGSTVNYRLRVGSKVSAAVMVNY